LAKADPALRLAGRWARLWRAKRPNVHGRRAV